MSFGRIARGCSPLRFRLGGLRMGRLISFGWIVCKWLFCLHGIVWKNMMKWVGAVPVCPPESPCEGASIVIPAHHACIFGMETPLRGRSGGHTGTAPTVSFGQIAYGRLVSLGKCGVGVISSVARRALHIYKWLRSILRAWGWNGFRAGRRPPSLCARRISRLLFGSR